MNTAQNLRTRETDMKKEADKALKQAFDKSGKYSEFIRVLSQRKNIGMRESPYWVTLDIPYMTVDGRITIMVEEHTEKNAKFEIKPVKFNLGPDTKTLLCEATVETMRGTATAHAKVGLNGSGVDSTNPYENAETSAIGRALGFLGYGLLGHGIASYEEVKGAMNDESGATGAPGAMGTSGAADTDKGEDIGAALKVKLKQALIKSGKDELTAAKEVSAIKSRKEAMDLLTALGARNAETDKQAAAGAADSGKSKDAGKGPEQTPGPAPEVANKEGEGTAPAKEEKKEEKAPEPPAAAGGDQPIKAADLLKLKKSLIKKGLDPAGILPKVRTLADLNAAKKEHGLED